MNLLKFLNKGVERFGYEMISKKDLDRLAYKALHREHTKAPDAVVAMDMKKSLLSTVKTPVIFDVGAYIGVTVEQYLSEFSGAKIHAFEPTEASFAKLKSKHTATTSVVCNKLAVTNRDGETTFNMNEFSPTNSCLPTDDQADSYWGEHLLDTNNVVTVKTTTIDSYCRRNKVERINLLKIDVQGAELSVLGGSKGMIENKNIDVIYLEVLYVPTYKNQSKYYEIEALLHENGYGLFGVFNLTYGDNQIKQADLLFCKN